MRRVEPHGISEYREAAKGLCTAQEAVDWLEFQMTLRSNHHQWQTESVQESRQLLISPNPALGMAVQLFHRVKATVLEG